METLPSSELLAAAELGPVARLLIGDGEHLRPATYSQIMALGPQAVPQLVEVLRNPRLADQNAPGEGWAPIHAAGLLGELRAVVAVDPMLELLSDSDDLDCLSVEILESLAAMGPPILERMLQVQPRFECANQLNPLNGVLAKLGIDPSLLTTTAGRA